MQRRRKPITKAEVMREGFVLGNGLGFGFLISRAEGYRDQHGDVERVANMND